MKPFRQILLRYKFFGIALICLLFVMVYPILFFLINHDSLNQLRNNLINDLNETLDKIDE